MGNNKHRGAAEVTVATTDAGKKWEELTPEERAEEMDASLQDPQGYAGRNFLITKATSYADARKQQREQQSKRKS